jgi:transcriptional regulator with XRE-family HTH domain
MLRELRNERGHSLRDLAQRSEIDHAYIHRLETGAKESPSAEVMTKLVCALALAPRDAEIVRFLADHPNIDPGLVSHVIADRSISFDEFHMLTTVVNRGARPDYATSLARIRRFMEEED